MTINNNTYDIVGFVTHQPGHFVAYGRRLRGVWEEYDDVARHPYIVPENRRIIPHLFLYVLRR